MAYEEVLYSCKAAKKSARGGLITSVVGLAVVVALVSSGFGGSGVLGFIIFGVALIIAIIAIWVIVTQYRILRHSGSVYRATPTGLRIFSPLYRQSYGPVPWSDIREIRQVPVGQRSAIQVCLKDPAAFYERMGPLPSTMPREDKTPADITLDSALFEKPDEVTETLRKLHRRNKSAA